MCLLSRKNNSPPSSARTEIFQVFSLHLSSNFHRGFVQKLSWQRTSSKRCYWNWRLSEVRIKTRDFCFIFIYCAESCSPFLSSELEKKAGGENLLAAPKFLAAPSGWGQFKSSLITARQIPCWHLPTPKLWPYFNHQPSFTFFLKKFKVVLSNFFPPPPEEEWDLKSQKMLQRSPSFKYHKGFIPHSNTC